LGAFIVIGHNVFHIVPNEVIVLSLVGLISIRLRDGTWSAMGFKRPASWRQILLIAVVAAILRILLGQFLIEPVTGFLWPKPTAPALANEIAGNIKMAVLGLLLVWTFAAFGEEIAYRGYLLTRAADVGNAIRNGLLDRDCARFDPVWVRALLQRRIGRDRLGVAGLILGSAYMLAGRNLWASIFAHGFIDTFGIIDAFLGWSN
jgi:membrane protease YdiL (CAAX protease family)